MTNKPYLRCATLLALALTTGNAAAASLKVHVTDAVPEVGTIEVSLFDSAESFLNEAADQRSGTPDEEGRFSAFFDNLEPGEYAVVVVHDENDNETYDAGFLGFGAEGLGYSNNAGSWFGRPGFDRVKFTMGTETLEMQISLD